MLTFECPSRSATTFGLTPWLIIHVAAVWRSPWIPLSGTSSQVAIASIASLLSWSDAATSRRSRLRVPLRAQITGMRYEAGQCGEL